MPGLAFYCVSDAAHFLGLVALVNSLRLLGHDETIYVLDCGFEPWQQAVLAQDSAVVTVTADRNWNPMLLKAALPLAHPAEVMVLVDVDVIFTDRVDALADTATVSGKSVLFPDAGWPDRFEPAWEQLGFGRPVPHPYIASGQFVLWGKASGDFLTLWAQGLERFANEPGLTGAGLPPDRNPFHFPDMDVLNALIGPAIPLDSFVVADLATVAYPPFEGVRIVDSEKLVVELANGVRPVLLHHFAKKPWNALVAPNPYSELMTRLLFAEDVALRAPRRYVTHSLRPGVLGSVARYSVEPRLWADRTFRGKLGIRAWLARRRLQEPRSSVGG